MINASRFQMRIIKYVKYVKIICNALYYSNISLSVFSEIMKDIIENYFNTGDEL